MLSSFCKGSYNIWVHSQGPLIFGDFQTKDSKCGPSSGWGLKGVRTKGPWSWP